MTFNTVGLLAGLLLAPAWLVWVGHGLRHKDQRTHSMFWAAVIGNAIGIVVVCVAIMIPPVSWDDSAVRGAVIHWLLLVLTAVGALAGWFAHRPGR